MVEVALLVVLGAAAGFLAWRLRRRHRGVPRGWQTDQSAAAELHRRLHRAVDGTRRAIAHAGGRGAPVDGIVGLVEDLETQARAIDAQLVAAARLPAGPRDRALREVKARIVALERLTVRVQGLAADLGGPALGAADDGLRDLAERLDALDEARREARDL